MGCDGCELWPTWTKLVRRILQVLACYISVTTAVQRRVKTLADEHADSTFRLFIKTVVGELIAGEKNQKAAIKEIRKLLKCYAGFSTENRSGNKGYPHSFNVPTIFSGRVAAIAHASDMSGAIRPGKPWLDGFPRLIFVSDMGDALSENISFEDLRKEIVDPVRTEMGARHIWLWLTKRPARMAKFAAWLNGQNISWPDNLVAMTTVTSQKTAYRIKQLLKVPAKVHALSVEPLFEHVTLPLEAIDWVIVGGESGTSAEPFHLEWATSIQKQCRAVGSTFFLKQMGANPFMKSKPLILQDSHGGDWNEWPAPFRVRDFPKQFNLLTPSEKGIRAHLHKFPAALTRWMARQEADREQNLDHALALIGKFLESRKIAQQSRNETPSNPSELA